MSRRAAVVVLDACGAGELPDAADYGDAGANTLAHVAEAVGGLDVPVLERPRARLDPSHRRRRRRRAGRPCTAASRPLGPGKDSTTGHWELMGVVPPAPLPTYPDGFPGEVVDARRRPRRACASAATARPTASR